MTSRTELGRLRRIAGLSQEMLATRVDVDRSTVARWERGASEPHAALRPRLANVLGVDLTTLHAALSAVLSEEPSSESVVDVESLRRRLTHRLGASVSRAALDNCQRLESHARASRLKPPRSVIEDLTDDLMEVEQLLSDVRSLTAMRELVRVTAQLAGLMCLALVKVDDRPGFRRWTRTARLAAGEAGDGNVRSWVLAQEAYGHYYAGDLRQAVDVAELAQSSARDPSASGPSLAAALAGRAWAARGEAASAELCIRTAEESFADLAPGPTVSALHYDEAQFRFHAGNVYTRLGRTRAAEQEQRRALELYADDDHLDRTLVHLDRAECRLTEGEAGAALMLIVSSLTELPVEHRSEVVRLRARAVLAAIPPSARGGPDYDDALHLVRSEVSG